MKVNVSIGELLDKYSVLELKCNNITDSNKLEYVMAELNILKDDAEKYIKQVSEEYNELKIINKVIWDLNDQVRDGYKMLANVIMDENDKRFRLKAIINQKCNSLIKEQKNFD